MKTNELIDKIVQKNEAVKRMRPPAVRAGLWLLWAAILMGVASAVLGLRDDLAEKLMSTLFLIEMLAALATGLLAALAAHWLSVPGAAGSRWLRWLPFVPLSILCAVILYHFVLQPVRLMEMGNGMHCIVDLFFVITLPTILLFMFLKRAATTHNRLTSFMAIMAVLAFGYFCSRLICGQDSLEHLLLWNYLPTVVIALLGAIIGSRLLKW